MTESQTAAILLVRTVEEIEPDTISTANAQTAQEQAGNPTDASAWISRRAAFLFEQLPPGYQSLLNLTKVSVRWEFALAGCASVLGFVSNYLNPTGKIHALWNPMLFLVGWNLLIYCILIAEGMQKRRRRPVPHSSELQSEQLSPPTRPAAPPLGNMENSPSSLFTRILYKSFPTLWAFWHRGAGHYKQARKFSRLVARFWRLWVEAAAPIANARLRQLLHIGAIGLALGAVLGSYMRGLFFEYNVVWRSTFIRDEQSIELLLKIVLFPATVLLGWSQEHWANVSQLMTPDGAPAATWIHLYTVTVVVCILVPRCGLILWESVYSRQMSRRLAINFQDAYYQTRLQPAREVYESQVAQMLEELVTQECARFTDAIAAYVCTHLYDERVVPLLRDFQKNGGSIAELETHIRYTCEAFVPVLQSYVAQEQSDFEKALLSRVASAFGNPIRGQFGLSEALQRVPNDSSSHTSSQFTNTFGYEFTDGLGVVVSATAAMLSGVVSGGFGHTIGVTIITSLLGTTGLVGFLIGAVAGLVITGAGWWLGRDSVHEIVKKIKLHSMVTDWVLWASGLEIIIDAGRKRCGATVKESIRDSLQPVIPRIVTHLRQQIGLFSSAQAQAGNERCRLRQETTPPPRTIQLHLVLKSAGSTRLRSQETQGFVGCG